jgi:hypothetical protein
VKDTISSFSKKERDVFAMVEYERWMEYELERGWRYGGEGCQNISNDPPRWGDPNAETEKHYYAADKIIEALESVGLALSKIMPDTYRKGGKDTAGNYVFISYSHRDREWVYRRLKDFSQVNLRFWYDIELKIGDEWDEEARYEIEDEKCVGAIIFLSENLAKSAACCKEIKIIRDQKNRKKQFHCCSFNKNPESSGTLFTKGCIDPGKLFNAILKSKDGRVDITECAIPNTVEWDEVDPETNAVERVKMDIVDRVKMMDELFSSNRIYGQSSNQEMEMLNGLIAKFRKLDAVDDDESFFEAMGVERGDPIMFGTYPIREDPYEAYIDGEHLDPVDNEWILLKSDDGKATLMSRYSVSGSGVFAADVEYTLQRFKDSCFNEKEKEAILSGPRLVSDKEFKDLLKDDLRICRLHGIHENHSDGNWWWVLDTENDMYSTVSTKGEIVGRSCGKNSKKDEFEVRAIVEVSKQTLIESRGVGKQNAAL